MIEEKSFEKNYPYYKNDNLDKVRKEDFPQLKNGLVYSDVTGANIPPKSLVEHHLNLLVSRCMGNPHSHHEPSAFAMQEIKSTRLAILRYFNADPEEYDVIFTPNATGAILILQHYLFDNGELLLTADNHNSVNGLREVAKRKGGVVRYSPINDDLSLDSESLLRSLNYPRSNGNKLFCYPAKSNYSGIYHDLTWVDIAQGMGWDVLLDASAFLSNKRLNLGEIKPDFVPVSFYKIFGYPTGIGCLIIKKSKYSKLSKRWFSGGSILLVSVMKDFFAPETIGYARFEDGTINFSSIPAIKKGLEFMESIGNFYSRVTSITSWLYDELKILLINDHSVIIHSPKGTDMVTFSIKKGAKIIDAWNFEKFANEEKVYVRTGCFCNPGVNEKTFGYSIDSYEKFYNDEIRQDQMTIENLRDYSDDKPIGAIRASFGYVNNFIDVYKFLNTVKKFMSQ